MGEIDKRLERGVAVFRRAGDDDALLGAALLAFHGALERYLDAALLEVPGIGEAERAQLEAGRLGWRVRADLAQQHGLLPEASARPGAGRRARTRGAGARRCLRLAGRRGPKLRPAGGQPVRPARAGGARSTRAPSARAPLLVVPPPIWQPPPRRFGLLRFAAAVLFLAVFVAVGWVIYTQIDGPRLLRALGRCPRPPPSRPSSTPTSTPTPPQRRALVVGLGGGPGWLHVSASFDSPTRAIRLADGMEVTMRDQQQVGTDGTRAGSWLRRAATRAGALRVIFQLVSARCAA